MGLTLMMTLGSIDVWNLHLHGNDRSLHLQINSCTANQDSSFWKIAEPLTLEPMDGRSARAKKLVGIGTGLGPAKGAPVPLSVLIPRKTLKVNFCIRKYCSYLRLGEIMAFYAF